MSHLHFICLANSPLTSDAIYVKKTIIVTDVFLYLYFSIQSTRTSAGIGEFGGGAGHGGQGGVAISSQVGGKYYDDVRQPTLPGSVSREGNIEIKGGGYIHIIANITRLDGECVLQCVLACNFIHKKKLIVGDVLVLGLTAKS